MKAWLAGTHKAPVGTTCIQGKSRPLNSKPPHPRHSCIPHILLLLLRLTVGREQLLYCDWHKAERRQKKCISKAWWHGSSKLRELFYLPARTQVWPGSHLEWKESLSQRFKHLICHSFSFFLFLIHNSKARNIFIKSPWILFAALIFLTVCWWF